MANITIYDSEKPDSTKRRTLSTLQCFSQTEILHRPGHWHVDLWWLQGQTNTNSSCSKLSNIVRKCVFFPLVCISLSGALTGAVAGSGLEALQEAEEQQLPSGRSGRRTLALRPPVAGRFLCIAAAARQADRWQHVALRVPSTRLF